MINSIDKVYAKNETKMPWPIELGLVYDENKTGKWRDRLYRSNLRKNQNKTIGTYLIGCGLWQKPNKIMTTSVV